MSLHSASVDRRGKVGEVDVVALRTVAVADLDVEALHAAGDLEADGAPSQDAEPGTGEAGDRAEAIGDALGPFAAPDHAVRSHDAPVVASARPTAISATSGALASAPW